MQGNLGIERMCQLAGVSRAGFYRHLSAQDAVAEDLELRSAIQRIVVQHKRRYGYRRIRVELAKAGMRINHKRLLRLMREDNLLAVQPKAFVCTTESDHELEVYLNLASRMKLTGVNQLWVADITYIPTWSGFLYLAVVLDVWSRRIVGWSMANHLKTELVLAAFDMAIAQRRPQTVIHHSDRGCQYTSYAFGKRCREAGVVPSMGSTGDAYDNAMAESFFATLEREVLNRRRFRSQAEARMAIFQWLEGWYNPHRRHSSLGYLSPINFERRMLPRAA